MVAAVVERALALAVLLDGEAAFFVGLDVVDLALISGPIARDVRALTIADLHGSAGRAGEEALSNPDIDHP